MEKVRIDKWLWAARFFKTRSLAKAALEGGKVQIDGQRSKPSRMIEVGMHLQVRQGWDEKTVEITALSGQRRGATEAALLYRETEDSIALRQRRQLQRQAEPKIDSSPGKPSKKQRRQIHKFRDAEW